MDKIISILIIFISCVKNSESNITEQLLESVWDRVSKESQIQYIFPSGSPAYKKATNTNIIHLLLLVLLKSSDEIHINDDYLKIKERISTKIKPGEGFTEPNADSIFKVLEMLTIFDSLIMPNVCLAYLDTILEILESIPVKKKFIHPTKSCFADILNICLKICSFYSHTMFFDLFNRVCLLIKRIPDIKKNNNPVNCNDIIKKVFDELKLKNYISLIKRFIKLLEDSKLVDFKFLEEIQGIS